jgi:transposase-like protein
MSWLGNILTTPIRLVAKMRMADMTCPHCKNKGAVYSITGYHAVTQRYRCEKSDGGCGTEFHAV